jgi:hypothetical protein
MNVNVTWKKALIGIVVVAAIAGGSYYAGRESQPDEVVLKTTDDYKWDFKLDDKSIFTEKLTFDWSKATNVKSNTKTVKQIVEKPTGEKVTTETTETTTEAGVKEENKGTVDTVVHNDVTIEDKGEHKQTTDLTIKNDVKNWTVAAGVETNLLDLRHLSAVTPTYYLSLSRHILTLGPVDLAAGVSVVSEGQIVSLENKAVIGFIEGSVSF